MNFRDLYATDAHLKSSTIAEIKACLLLAIPLVGAQLSQAATAFVDTVMMGILGSHVLAAGALGAAAFCLLTSIGSALVSAVSPLAAQAYGAGRLGQMGGVVRQGLWLSLFLAIPVTLLLWWSGSVLHGLGQDPDTVSFTQTYLRAIAWGYFPGLGFAVLRSFVLVLAKPRPIFAIAIGGTLFNIAANYVLAFGKFGFPALGLSGLGWASTLSLWGMFATLVIYIISQPQCRRCAGFSRWYRFEAKGFGELMRVGVPIGILAGIECGFFTVLTFLMGYLGIVTLAAHQIALQTAVLTHTIPFGIAMATTVRVGQFVGQGNLREARLAGFVGMGVAGLMMAVSGLVFLSVPGRIISLFIDTTDPTNAAIATSAKSFLHVAATFQIVDGIHTSVMGALRGLKDTRVPLAIGLFAYWGIALACGYWLAWGLGWGGVGLWWGLAMGLAVAAIVLTWRFSTAKIWRKM